MAILIETGAGLPDSNSYASVAELRAYALLRGAEAPDDDEDCEVLLIKAMDSLETRNFVGCKLTQAQALQWPRADAYVDEWPIPYNEIPRQLIQGQCALAIEAQTTDLLPTTEASAAGPIISETVGPITTVWANPTSVRRVPAVARAEALLCPLIKRSGLVAVRT
jgi:hypothetical protein